MTPNRQQRRHAKKHGRAALALLVATALATGALPAMSVEAAEAPALLIQGGGGGGGGVVDSAGGGGGGGAYIEYYDGSDTFYQFGGGGRGGSFDDARFGLGGSISGGAGFTENFIIGGNGGASGGIAGGIAGDSLNVGQGNDYVDPAPGKSGTSSSLPISISWATITTDGGSPGEDGDENTSCDGGAGGDASLVVNSSTDYILELNKLTIYGGENGANGAAPPYATPYDGGVGGTATFTTAGKLYVKEIVLGSYSTYTRTQADVNLNVGTLVSKKGDKLDITSGASVAGSANISNYASESHGIVGHEFDLSGAANGDTIRTVSGGPTAGTIAISNDTEITFTTGSVPTDLAVGDIITLLGRTDAGSAVNVVDVPTSFTPQIFPYDESKSMEIKISSNGDLVMEMVEKYDLKLVNTTGGEAFSEVPAYSYRLPAGTRPVTTGTMVRLEAIEGEEKYVFDEWEILDDGQSEDEAVWTGVIDWYTGYGPEDQITFFEMPAADVTVRPKFTDTTPYYMVTMREGVPVNSGTGTVADPSGATTGGVEEGHTVTLTASAADLHTFKHWETSRNVTWTTSEGVPLEQPPSTIQGTQTAHFAMPAEEVSVTPHFERTYGIIRRVTPSGSGNVSCHLDGAPVSRTPAGERIQLEARANAGFRFHEWQLEEQNAETGAWTSWTTELLTEAGAVDSSADLNNATIYVKTPETGKNIRATAHFSANAPTRTSSTPIVLTDDYPPLPAAPDDSGLTPDPVKTGDSATAFTWPILLSISALGLVGIYLWHKKRPEKWRNHTWLN